VRAAVLAAYHRPLELVGRPDPEIARPDQVLLRVAGAGVCATDLHAMDGLMEPAGVTLPRVLGHENTGVVEAVGSLVSTVAAGDAVMVYPPYSCGLCLACRRGFDMHCERHQFTGLTVDGGFAERLVVAERQVIPLPAGVDPVTVAPHADAGLTAYHAVRRVAHLLLPGSVAVVVGVGGVGHIALQLVRELGAASVVAVDTDPGRRALARDLRADEVLDGRGAVDAVRELTGGRGADVVLDVVGTDDTHAAGLDMLARHGTYALVGYGGTITRPSLDLVANEKTAIANLVGTWPDLWEVLQLHAADRIVLRTETHPLDAINDVLDRLRAGEVTGRAVIAHG
jgi:NAD+-dependent secondary alcohol dehydrogenase Adh1